MSFTVRKARPGDVPSLEVVRRQAIEAGLSARYPRPAFADLVATPDERLPRWIASDSTLVLVTETEITAVAYGGYDPATGRILALYTAPEYQGSGCATALLDRFERRARDDGRGELRATVPLNAVGFFDRRGFDRRGETERDGVAMVECAKSLS